jgi:hypothetical protein
VLGGLGAVAVIVGPAGTRAADDGGSGPPLAPDRQRVLDALATLVGRSTSVLAIHDRGPTPFSEIVLWLQDAANPGVVDAEEVGVLSHSLVLESIAFHGLVGRDLPDDDALRALQRLVEADVAAPAFCDAWRTSPGVGRHLVATGISDLQAAWLDAGGGEPALQIFLTWTEDSADGADEASVLIDAVAPSPGPPE